MYGLIPILLDYATIQKKPTAAIDDITRKFVSEMKNFINESSHMEKLKNEKLIDQELYDLWLENELKKRNFPIMLHYCNKLINPFTGEEV